MKCDIQSKFSPKCTPNFVCVYFYWFENNICQKKIRLFQPKNFRIFFCQNPFQAIKRLKKKNKKKWHGPLNHQGGGVKSLVVRPLKKTLFFYVCLPLQGIKKNFLLDLRIRLQKLMIKLSFYFVREVFKMDEETITVPISILYHSAGLSLRSLQRQISWVRYVIPSRNVFLLVKLVPTKVYIQPFLLQFL